MSIADPGRMTTGSSSSRKEILKEGSGNIKNKGITWIIQSFPEKNK